jgi:hypothetical protein
MDDGTKLQVEYFSLDMMLQTLERAIRLHTNKGEYTGRTEWLTKYQELRGHLYERIQKDK